VSRFTYSFIPLHSHLASVQQLTAIVTIEDAYYHHLSEVNCYAMGREHKEMCRSVTAGGGTKTEMEGSFHWTLFCILRVAE
jgi:hypothetical protein